MNKEKILIILLESDCNGKSIYTKLVKNVFGDYFMFFPNNILDDTDSNLIESARFINKRFAFTDMDGVNKININFVKLHTIENTIAGRRLHNLNIINFKPSHKIGIICNNIPEIDAIDPIVLDKIKCIEFPVTFVNKPSNANEKKIDYKISDKLTLWKQDFMLLLIEKYKQYRLEGLEPTTNIIKYTKIFKEKYDIYLQYLKERTDISNTYIDIVTLYSDFKQWFLNKNPTNKIPSMN